MHVPTEEPGTPDISQKNELNAVLDGTTPTFYYDNKKAE